MVIYRSPIFFVRCIFTVSPHSTASPLLIVGLGNPGRDYEWTRHNFGFMLIDYLARSAGAPELKRGECRALVGRAEIEGATVELIKPQTYMNLSGEAIACLMKKRDLRAADSLIVISDDLALPFGTMRLRTRGSSGGQKGLGSIIQTLKTDEFIRLRLGIQPDHPVHNAAGFVLDRFPANARDDVDKILERGAEALRAVIRDGIDKAMSQYNGDK